MKPILSLLLLVACLCVPVQAQVRSGRGPIIGTGAAGAVSTTVETSATAAEEIRGAILGREYDAVIVTTAATNLSTTLAAITDASELKRYRLVLSNGTYELTLPLNLKSYIDLWGESQDGVIVQNTSAITTPTNSFPGTLRLEGEDVLLANFTVNQYGEGYGVHIDASTIMPSSTAVLYKMKLVSHGPDGKAPCGMAGYANQRGYFVDCTLINDNPTSDYGGILLHNKASQTAPTSLYVINCELVATNSIGPALWYYNNGSGQPDQLHVIGGTARGANVGVGSRDLFIENQGAGASETFININGMDLVTSNVTGKTWSLPALVPVPNHSNRYRRYNGILQPSASTVQWNTNGYFYGSVVYWKASATAGNTTEWKQAMYTKDSIAYLGVNGGTANAIGTGSEAYSAALGTLLNYPLNLFVQNTNRFKITSTNVLSLAPFGLPPYAKSSRPTTGLTAGVGIFQTTDTPGPRWYDGTNWLTAAGVADP